MITAYVVVSTTNPGPRRACQEIRGISGVARADARYGGPPVVAIIEAPDLSSLDEIVDRIVELPMVTDTETHVARLID